MFTVNKPEMVNKTFRMPAELVERLNKVAQSQKVSLNNLQQYCDWRRSTDLHRFSYCPDCGAKIDWGKIKREAARPPP